MTRYRDFVEEETAVTGREQCISYYAVATLTDFADCEEL